MAIPGIKKFTKGKTKAPQGRYLVALDIGTEFVKALIGEVECNQAP
jgi:cell division ATPase FtsA